MRILGFVIGVVGLVVLICGINASQTVAEKVVEGMCGNCAEHAMWYILGGIAMVLGGGGLAIYQGSCCCRK